MKVLSALSLFILPGLLLSEAQAQWFQPYPNGSADDHLIRFDAGPTGSVTAPDPVVGVGFTYSAVPAVGAAAGWYLTASGSVGFGDGEDSRLRVTRLAGLVERVFASERIPNTSKT